MNPSTNPLPVDYATPVARTRPRPPIRLTRRQLVILVMIAVVLVVGWLSCTEVTSTDIDAVTGSRVTSTNYLFGVRRAIETSAVEQRMRAIGATWRPRWQFLHRKARYFFWPGVSYECGTSPPVYSLHGIDVPMLSGLTDAEVVAFVRLMESARPDAEKYDAAQDVIYTVIARDQVAATRPATAPTPAAEPATATGPATAAP